MVAAPAMLAQRGIPSRVLGLGALCPLGALVRV